MESIFEVKNRNRFISSMNPQERNQKYSGWKNAVEKVLV
jgi:glycerol kinase